MSSQTLQSLRAEVLKKYPSLELGKLHPWQALWFVVLLGAVLILSGEIVTRSFPVYALLLLSVLLGLTYASLGLFTHELLHGSVFGMKGKVTRALTRVMAWFGFVIFGLSPELWLRWHNQVHHFNTNRSGVDPDSFGLFEYFAKVPMSSFVLKRSPGARHWLAWVYLPLNFSNQVATVMWYFLFSGDQSLFGRVNKPVAVFETLSMYFFWAAFWMKFGWPKIFWIFIVPTLVANLVVSGYILVQHLMCPLTEVNDPFENTLGVSSMPVLDLVHFNFGHHIEHHLFPEVSSQEYPALRAFLRKEYQARYRCMPHSRALKLLLKTPRVYRDHQTLWDPSGERIYDVSQTGRSQ
jgi:fatty acid desaturase